MTAHLSVHLSSWALLILTKVAERLSKPDRGPTRALAWRIWVLDYTSVFLVFLVFKINAIQVNYFAAIFAQHYSPSHNGVYIQNIGYCGYLCINKAGRVYSNVIIGHLFNLKYKSVYMHGVAGRAGGGVPVQHKLTPTRHYWLSQVCKYNKELNITNFWGCSRSQEHALSSLQWQ